VVTTEDGLAITGRGHDIDEGAEVDVAIRPESIKFLSPSEAADYANEPNVFEVEVARASYVGELIDYQLRIKTHLIRAKGEVRVARGVGVRFLIKLDADQLAVLCR